MFFSFTTVIAIPIIATILYFISGKILLWFNVSDLIGAWTVGFFFLEMPFLLLATQRNQDAKTYAAGIYIYAGFMLFLFTIFLISVFFTARSERKDFKEYCQKKELFKKNFIIVNKKLKEHTPSQEYSKVVKGIKYKIKNSTLIFKTKRNIDIEDEDPFFANRNKKNYHIKFLYKGANGNYFIYIYKISAEHLLLTDFLSNDKELFSIKIKPLTKPVAKKWLEKRSVKTFVKEFGDYPEA